MHVVFAILLLLSSCKTPGPDVATCISDPESDGFQCEPRRADPNQDAYFVTFQDTGNYVCFDPNSWAVIVEWIKRNSKNRTVIYDLKNRGILYE